MGYRRATNAPGKRLIDRWFPDRQVLVRGTDRFVAINLSQRAQLAGVSLVALSAVWLAGATLGMALTAGAAGRAVLAEQRLARSAAAAQEKMSELLAENAALTAQRDQAVAQADQLRDQAVAAVERRTGQAVAQADLARDEAVARATLLAAANRAALDQLVQRTEGEIGQIDAIIRATGLNPDHFAASQVPRSNDGTNALTKNPGVAGGPEEDDLLLDDLGELDTLGGALQQMPLAAPVARISVTSPFGYRPDPWTGAREFHVGVDLRGAVGTPVYATAPGIVSFAGVATGYGNLVTIEHGYGLQTRYSHLQKILVRVGAPVDLHQEIGLLGNTGWSTGPHLLYETRVDGQPRNPLNFIKVGENVQN